MHDPSTNGLRPVPIPSVSAPTAARWVPRRAVLVVGTRQGEILRLDPALASCTTVAASLGEVAALDVDGTRYVAASRDGRLVVGTLAGAERLRLDHPFRGAMQVLLAEQHTLLVGDLLDSRVLLVVSLAEQAIVGRVRLPPHVVPSLAPDGRPLLCRSTRSGLSVIHLGRGHHFPTDEESTTHHLRVFGRYVVGFDPSTLIVWSQDGAVRRTIRWLEVAAAGVSADGRTVAVGTTRGAVARVDLPATGLRPNPVRVFREPVTTVAVADVGRWLAAGAEDLRIWSWE